MKSFEFLVRVMSPKSKTCTESYVEVSKMLNCAFLSARCLLLEAHRALPIGFVSVASPVLTLLIQPLPRSVKASRSRLSVSAPDAPRLLPVEIHLTRLRASLTASLCTP
jgi:hypothetical protein